MPLHGPWTITTGMIQVLSVIVGMLQPCPSTGREQSQLAWLKSSQWLSLCCDHATPRAVNIHNWHDWSPLSDCRYVATMPIHGPWTITTGMIEVLSVIVGMLLPCQSTGREQSQLKWLNSSQCLSKSCYNVTTRAVNYHNWHEWSPLTDFRYVAIMSLHGSITTDMNEVLSLIVGILLSCHSTGLS